jgi:hypothetical protein
MHSKVSFLRIITVAALSSALFVLVPAQMGWSAVPLNDFMQVAERGQSATIEGMVSRVWQRQGRIGLIDTGDLMECQSEGCAKTTLVVLWKGDMPEVFSTIQITGAVTSEGRMMLNAESLEVVAPAPAPDFKSGGF